MRHVLRTLLVVAILAVATYLLGYWSLNQTTIDSAGRTIGTSGQTGAATAREIGADVGERVSQAAQKVGDLASDSSLTAKIKAKMALDDSVRARTIDVTTVAGVVTLTGTVRSGAERAQAVRLARETTGITRVTDRIVVRQEP